MGARAELHHFAILQAGSKTLGKAGRDEGAGIPSEKQLWIMGRCQRRMRLLEDGIDVRRLARDRQFVRQPPGRATRFRRGKRCAVDGHLLLAQLSQDGARQYPFNEGIAVKDHLFAFARRPELAKCLARGRHLVEVIPRRHRPDKFHEGEPADEVRPARREMEGQRRSPILRHEIGRPDTGSADEGVEITHLILKAIVNVGLAGLAVADQIRGDASRHRRDERDDVAPDVGRCGVAVEQEGDWRPWPPHLAIGHRRIEYGSLWQREVSNHRGRHLPGSLKTVAKAIRLNRCSGSAVRVTFMRRIAPSQEARRKSASSSGAKVLSISPLVWASWMQAAKRPRHSMKMATSRSRSISLTGAASRLKSPIRQPRANSSASRRSVMM